MRLFQAFDEIEDMMADGRRLVVSADSLEKATRVAGRAVTYCSTGISPAGWAGMPSRAAGETALGDGETPWRYCACRLLVTFHSSAPAAGADYNHRSGSDGRLSRCRNLSMPILWLRVALCCYAVGLLYALLALTRTSSLLNRVALPAMSLGMVFQFVSLTEAVLLSGQLTLASVHNSESLLALMVMAAFMIVYLVYRTTSPGIVVFPLVFVLTFVAATTQQPFLLASPGMRRGWLFAHIAMIFTGYAALFLSFAASLLYLLQERSLKSKKPAAISVAPAGAGSD